MDTNQSQQSYWFDNTVTSNFNDIGNTTYTYDKLRKMTEVLYIIREYLPNNNQRYNTFTILLYEDIQKIYDEIYTNKLLFSKNNEKIKVVNTLLEEMRNVEDILIPLLPETYIFELKDASCDTKNLEVVVRSVEKLPVELDKPPIIALGGIVLSAYFAVKFPFIFTSPPTFNLPFKLASPFNR